MENLLRQRVGQHLQRAERQAARIGIVFGLIPPSLCGERCCPRLKRRSAVHAVRDIEEDRFRSRAQPFAAWRAETDVLPHTGEIRFAIGRARRPRGQVRFPVACSRHVRRWIPNPLCGHWHRERAPCRGHDDRERGNPHQMPPGAETITGTRPYAAGTTTSCMRARPGFSCPV